MATATRSKAEVLKNVVATLLDNREDGPILRALNNGAFNTPEDHLSLNAEEIDHLEVPEDTEVGVKVYRPLQCCYIFKLRLFMEWYNTLVNAWEAAFDRRTSCTHC